MLNLLVEHPTSDITRDVQAPPDGTPSALIDHLLEADHADGPFLKPPKNDSQYGLVNNRTGRGLDPNTAFSNQDVQDGDTLNITLSASGAAPTTERLQMDFASVQCVLEQGRCVTGFWAYTDATMQRVVETYKQSHLARYYLVRYGISLPINKYERIDDVILSFDLSRVFSKYPHSEIHDVRAVKSIPWHHRIHKNGQFCTGGFRDEAFLLGNTVVHLARMLNFDEPPGSLDDDPGYQKDAVPWYKKTFNGPVDPQLKYPIINMELLTRFQTDRGFTSSSRTATKSSTVGFSSRSVVPAASS